MVEILKNIEIDTQSALDELKKSIKKHPDKDPDAFDNGPESVKNITLKPEYLANNKDFFSCMTEFLNKNIDDIEKVNASRKDLNKGIKTANPIIVDGVPVWRFAVTSFFAKENNEVVLKNFSEIVNNQKIYTLEAKVKTFMYNGYQTLLFETDDKEYDYDVILHDDGEISIVQKNTKKNKELKLTTKDEILKFEALLKEIFPPAYIAYRDKALQELTDKDNEKQKKK